ncbi:glycerate kinase [Streptococcus suis]|nr:glycerate kinase [Streptococcus suis]UUD27876.1 glycerate kinase [Streptococcus suis]
MLLDLAGAGAGGGMAAGLVQFAGARIQKGIDFVLDQLDFAHRVTKCGSGCGRRRADGCPKLIRKTPIGVARRRRRGFPSSCNLW